MKNKKKVKDIIRTDNSGKDPRFPLGVLGYQVNLSNSSRSGKKGRVLEEFYPRQLFLDIDLF